jgi:uncharacterized protein YcbX
MTARLAAIWRHPVKGIGAEALDAAELSPDGALIGDRAWALLHAAAPDSDAWQPRRNFLVVASGPGLAAVSARTEADGRIALRHPERPPLSFAPETEADALMAWVTPIWPADRPAPARLIRAPGHGMTDMPDPFVSIGSLSSLRALSQRAGMALDPRRFRINLWVDGLPPWEEADAIGARWTVGGVPLDIAEPIGRCRAPEANPETGRRDAATNRLLEDAQGTTDFGVYARVAAPGTVRVGDAVKTG